MKIIPVWLSLLFPLSLAAQYTVTGTVLDSATREPLQAASVYCQNSTSGTYTNKQGEFSLALKPGSYDLVVSYTGYQTQNFRVDNSSKTEILLVKEDKSLSEVVVKASNEVQDGWTKYGDFFIQHFIGRTPNAAQTSLSNPEVLKFYFYKRSNKLKVLATDALQISNLALGYTIRYQLDSFVYYYNSNASTYRGFCLFTEMNGSDSLKMTWATARKNAYYGSKLHFMRSYFDSTLKEDGWEIEMLKENSENKYLKITNPYDTLYYGDPGDSSNQVEIYYPRKIIIIYTKKKPEPEYIKQWSLSKYTDALITYTNLKNAVDISENGYYFNPSDWVDQGYWSWKNLADLLPYDYEPN